jgi:predicted  nucleic acid-binding Zn-ribbon protein
VGKAIPALPWYARLVSDYGGIAGFYRALIRAQVLRTCSQCGCSWKVWRYDTKRHFAEPSDHLPMGFAQAEAITNKVVYQQRVDEARRLSNENQDQVGVRSLLGQCPKCGSDRFSEHRMWRVSKADYRGDNDDD